MYASCLLLSENIFKTWKCIHLQLRNQVVSSLIWLWWDIDLMRFEFESRTVSFVLPLFLFCLENHVCLSHGVQVVGVAWRVATSIMTGVGDLVQRIGDDRTGRVLGGWAIERSGDAVCGLHRAQGDEEREFFSWASKPRSTVCTVSHQSRPQNRWRRFVSGFTSKPLRRFVSGFASKPLGHFLIGLSLKIDDDGLSVVWL
jgi:hypothetical protein